MAVKARFDHDGFMKTAGRLMNTHREFVDDFNNFALGGVELYHQHKGNIAYVEKVLEVAAHSRVSYAVTAAWISEQISHKVARSLTADWRKKLEAGEFHFVIRDSKGKVVTSPDLKIKAKGWRKFQTKHPKCLDYKADQVAKALDATQVLRTLYGINSRLDDLAQLKGLPKQLHDIIVKLGNELDATLYEDGDDGMPKKREYNFIPKEATIN